MQPVAPYPHLTPVPDPAVTRVEVNLGNSNVAVGVNWLYRFAYVLFKMDLSRTRPTRIMFSDHVVDTWKLGTVLTLEDVKGPILGEYMIVGVKENGNNEHAGQIPDRLIKACRLV